MPSSEYQVARDLLLALGPALSWHLKWPVQTADQIEPYFEEWLYRLLETCLFKLNHIKLLHSTPETPISSSIPNLISFFPGFVTVLNAHLLHDAIETLGASKLTSSSELLSLLAVSASYENFPINLVKTVESHTTPFRMWAAKKA